MPKRLGWGPVRGLIMHSSYYANEVRNFADIAKGENAKLSDEEIEL